MGDSLLVLLVSAASIGFFHTLLGPDHYLPFILLSRSRTWSTVKTMSITVLCGLGHVGGSIVLGLLGVFFGWSLYSIEIFESSRGNVASWLLIIFGGIYLVWGIFKAYHNKPHTHWHKHMDGSVHTHLHDHSGEHKHVHEVAEGKKLTPWILFIIFVFGPCEPLIPILIFPASEGSVLGLILVITAFSLATILTMTGIVYISVSGLKLIYLGKLERFSHAIAGAFIFLSGIGIQFFGL
jgi:ABC-type nickel/cobalt efflux system permease component RcnA